MRAVAAVVRVAEADGGLEGGAAADELVVGQLPERLVREEAGLHHLRHALAPLLRRQRLEQRGVDDRPDGPVEGADEVLALRQVDRGLAADRGVDLRDEARRHGHPGECRGGRSRRRSRRRRSCSRRRARRASRARSSRSSCQSRSSASERLRLLAERQLVRLREARAERELRVHAVDACDVRIARRAPSEPSPGTRSPRRWTAPRSTWTPAAASTTSWTSRATASATPA